MDGVFHYRQAERLLAEADETHDGQPADTNIARAQVHATLALAAATALLGPVAAGGYADDKDLKAWAEAAGTKPGTAADLIGRAGPALVSSPDWRGGEPVRVLEARWAGESYDEVSVRYQDVHCRENAVQVLVSADHPITLVGGGR